MECRNELIAPGLQMRTDSQETRRQSTVVIWSLTSGRVKEVDLGYLHVDATHWLKCIEDSAVDLLTWTLWKDKIMTIDDSKNIRN